MYVYFRAEHVGGSRVAATFVASLVLFELAWICVYLLREVKLRDPEWRQPSTGHYVMGMGGLMALGGAWLMILGHWGAIALVLVAVGLVGVGLWTLSGFLTARGEEQAEGSSGLSLRRYS